MGYKNINTSPKITTVPTAKIPLKGSLFKLDSSAKTAAAPQIALPAPTSIEVSLSSLKIFIPTNKAIIKTKNITIAESKNPFNPTLKSSVKVILKPYKTIPSLKSFFALKCTPA